MSLNELKPAWKQFKLIHSLPAISEEEILRILEEAESKTSSKKHVLLLNTIIFLVLTLLFQGG